jgi:hypothetical protein
LVRKKVHAGFNVRPQNDNSFVLYYWERRQQAIKIRKRDHKASEIYRCTRTGLGDTKIKYEMSPGTEPPKLDGPGANIQS